MLSRKFLMHVNEFKFHFFFEKGDVKYLLIASDSCSSSHMTRYILIVPL